MKSRNCLVVNWNSVESLRDRSNGSIIDALDNNGLSRHCSPIPHKSGVNADFFNTPLPPRFTYRPGWAMRRSGRGLFMTYDELPRDPPELMANFIEHTKYACWDLQFYSNT